MKTEVRVAYLQTKDNLEPPVPGRGKQVFSRAGEVVTAAQHLEFGLLAQHRAFALAIPSARDTFCSSPPSVGSILP